MKSEICQVGRQARDSHKEDGDTHGDSKVHGEARPVPETRPGLVTDGQDDDGSHPQVPRRQDHLGA